MATKSSKGQARRPRSKPARNKPAKPARGEAPGSKATQFKEGTSGNPSGRPLGTTIMTALREGIESSLGRAGPKGVADWLDALRVVDPGKFLKAVQLLKDYELDEAPDPGGFDALSTDELLRISGAEPLMLANLDAATIFARWLEFARERVLTDAGRLARARELLGIVGPPRRTSHVPPDESDPPRGGATEAELTMSVRDELEVNTDEE